MSEYDDLAAKYIPQMRGQAATAVTTSTEDNPDDAARAIELGRSAGVAPDVIYNNLEDFQKFHRAAMSSQIVQGNQHLQDYANSHPLAAKVSNDDWGNLDNVSRSLDAIPQQTAMTEGMIKYRRALKEGIKQTGQTGIVGGPNRLGSWMSDATFNEMMQTPQGQVNYALAAMIGAGIELPLRGGSAAIHGVASGLSAAYHTAVGGSEVDKEETTQHLEQLATDPNTIVMMSGLPVGNPLVALEPWLARLNRLEKKTAPYVHAETEPRKGLDSLIDNAKSEQSKADVEGLYNALKEAQSSNTRERDPEGFRNFIAQKNAGSIGINVDAVRRLYGDKPPTPDDGILGWVPNIEQQIRDASWDHGDIHVPLADWLTKMDPAIARELKDDTRPRPGGYTLNETKTVPPPSVEPEGPVAQAPKNPEARIQTLREKEEAEGTPRSETLGLVNGIRDTAGVGPKVKLVHTFAGEDDLVGTHEFDFVDPQGNKLGDGQVTIDGTNIHVDYMRADGDGVWKLGPGAILDLGKQLREMFPEAKTISGARIGGAREGMEEAPVIKRPLYPLRQETHEDLSRLIETSSPELKSVGDRVDFGKGITAVLADHFTSREAEVYDAVGKVLSKIASRLPEGTVQAVRDLQMEGGKVQGLYYTKRSTGLPYVMWALESRDAVGTLRHEIIHVLRRNGFLTREEWVLLRDAAIKEDWLGKYNINARYKDLGLAGRIEEAVAEHFAHINRADYWKDRTLTGHEKVLGKLRNLWEQLRTAIRGVLGKDADYRDVIAKIEKGEVGDREMGQPLTAKEVAAQRPKEPKQGELDVTRIEDRPLIDRAKAFGMTEKEYRQILEKHLAKDDADTKFANEQNRKQIERRQTAEWKAQEKIVRDRVEPGLRNRADIAADRFLRDGTLYDQKIEGRPKLDSAALSEEQKATLPKDYYGKGGIHPDDMASLFGMHSGDDLVGRLGQLQVERGNLNPQQHFRKVLAQEVARQMRFEHGDLAKNILDEAEDHIVSSTQINLMNDELFAAATKAGTALPFTKENIDNFIKNNFESKIVGDLSKEEFMHNANKARQMEVRELLDDNPAMALKQQQAHRFAFGYLKEMKAFEKVQKRFQRLIDRYESREVKGREAEYTNVIHDLMNRFGIAVDRTRADLAGELSEQGYQGLKDFVSKVNGPENINGLFLDDRLYDPNQFLNPDGTNKKWNQLTVEEYRALTDALTQLDKASGDLSKYNAAQGKLELAEVIRRMKEHIEANYDVKIPEGENRIRKGLRRFLNIGLLNPETWANRFDRDDMWGPFNQFIVRPMVTAANREATLGREFGKKYLDIGEVDDPNRKVTAPFNDPHSVTEENPNGSKYANFTRKNVAAMISNWGNPYNRDVLSKGYGSDEAFLHNWLGANSYIADWQRAEKLGKVFNELFEMAQDVYRGIHGVAPPKIDLAPFEIQTKDGLFVSEGWYHPIIKDLERTKQARGGLPTDDLLDQDKGFYPSIANGYIKRRTGQIDVLSLTHEFIPSRLSQIVHDISYRAEMTEVAKIVRDKGFQQVMRQRLGSDYLAMFNTWLKDIAGAPNMNGRSTQWAANLSNYLLSNTVGTLIGFNPSTVMKHLPTAWVNSMYEVGSRDFLKAFNEIAGAKGASYYHRAVDSIFRGDEERAENIVDFIRNNSEEIRRRERNWIESFGGAQKVLEGKLTWKESIIKYGSKPVALSDMISAMPTWLAEYNRVLEETGNHGDAVFAGDRAVRRAHGSTARTNLPEMVRQAGPYGQWLTSVYGFFSTMMQRRAEIAFKLNDAYKLGREGEIKDAAKMMGSALPQIFAAMIWPTIIEEGVTAIGTDDHRTFLSRLVHSTWYGIASSLMFVRDIGHGIGVAQTAAEDLRNAARDITEPEKYFSRQRAGKSIQDLITAFGIATGMAPAQVGRTARYGFEVMQGTERPQGPADVALGAMKGTTKLRKVK